MPDIPLPEDLSTYIRGMESRIRALETAPRAQDTELPWASNFVDVFESTNSLSYANLATVGPTVTMNTTNTTRVLVTAAAYVLSPTNTSANVGLYVDGVLFADLLQNGNASAATLAMSLTNVRQFYSPINLAAGPHTFQLRYKTTAPGAGFGARFLIVQPF